MKETPIHQMRKRHEREIEKLRKNCKHEELSVWIPFEWAPAHRDGEVRICLACEKIIESRGQMSQTRTVP